ATDGPNVKTSVRKRGFQDGDRKSGRGAERLCGARNILCGLREDIACRCEHQLDQLRMRLRKRLRYEEEVVVCDETGAVHEGARTDRHFGISPIGLPDDPGVNGALLEGSTSLDWGQERWLDIGVF